jgi:Holliday junction resolvase RusA-like endonuclease
MLKIVIEGNAITKKNHGRIIQKRLGNGKTIPIMLPSEAFTKYEQHCKQFIPTLDKPIDYPINLKCTYYMETRRKCDITNLLQATCDILVKYKVIEDDNYTIISSIDGTNVQYDKDNPRTIIEITKKED